MPPPRRAIPPAVRQLEAGVAPSGLAGLRTRPAPTMRPAAAPAARSDASKDTDTGSGRLFGVSAPLGRDDQAASQPGWRAEAHTPWLEGCRARGVASWQEEPGHGSDGARIPLSSTPTPSETPGRVVLGLLGGIGSGKSFVAGRIAAVAGATVIDADREAHAALAACAADGSLAEALGPEFVEDGRPQVERLGARVFEDAALLKALERLLHPHVHASIRKAVLAHRAGEGADVLVLDVPLLLETGLDRDCDVLWYVELPDALRLERAEARGISAEEIERRESFQTPRTRKRARADRLIHNDVEPEALDDQIRKGLHALGVELPPTTA